MAIHDPPENPDQRGNRREKANRIAAISYRISEIGGQISSSLNGLREQLLSLVENIQADSKSAETRENINHHESIREIKRTANVTIGLTVVSLMIAGGTAWILYNQLYSMRIEQRAWITVEQRMVEMNKNKPLISIVTMKNMGKTPAKRIEGQYKVRIFKKDQALDLILDPSDPLDAVIRASRGVLNPGVSDITEVPMIKDGSSYLTPPVVTEKEAEEIIGGETYAISFGRITYIDVYDISHWINFCFVSINANIKGKFNYKKCIEYNDADNN